MAAEQQNVTHTGNGMHPHPRVPGYACP